MGARSAGEIREGQRRFPLTVRLSDRERSDLDALAATLIPTAGGPIVRVDQVTRLAVTEGPSTIQREWGRRRVTVQCNVRDRDVASFVAEAKRRIASQGGKARRESLAAARRIVENLRYARAVEELRGAPRPILREPAFAGRLPGLYPELP